MLKLGLFLVLVLLFSSSVYALEDGTGYDPYTNNDYSITWDCGVRFIPFTNYVIDYIHSPDPSTGTTPTKCYIYNVTNSLLFSGNLNISDFANLDCFPDYPVYAGIVYFATVDNNGGSFDCFYDASTSVFPIATSYTNFTHTVEDITGSYASYFDYPEGVEYLGITLANTSYQVNSYNVNISDTNYHGNRYLFNQPTRLIQVNVSDYSNASKCYIWNSSLSVIDTTLIENNICYFDINLNASEVYYIMTGDDGVLYDGTYTSATGTFNDSYVEWIGGYDAENVSYFYEIESIDFIPSEVEEEVPPIDYYNNTLFAHWKFENNGDDELGIYNLSEVGTVSFDAGIDGNCTIRINSVNYFTSSNQTLIDSVQRSKNWTIDVWIQANNSVRYQHIWGTLTSDSANNFLRVWNWDDLWYWYDNNYYYILENNIVNNQWYHIAITNEVNGNITGYLDGVQKFTNVNPSNNTDSIMTVGYDATTGDFPGRIDELRIFNEVMPIEFLYNITEDVYPLINVNSPDGENINDVNVTFDFEMINGTEYSLYINDTLNLTGSGNYSHLENISFEEGEYEYYIIVNNTNFDTYNISDTYNFSVFYNYSQCYVLYPEENFLSENGSVEFNFTVVNSTYWEFILNEFVNETNTTNGNFSLNRTLDEGFYNWSVYCENEYFNNNMSTETRNLTVNFPSPVINASVNVTVNIDIPDFDLEIPLSKSEIVDLEILKRNLNIIEALIFRLRVFIGLERL